MPVTPGPERLLDVRPDGTVRQRSPVTGTVVWTVPGRANRPLPRMRPAGRPLATSPVNCPFCPGHFLLTTPEKSRLVGSDGADPSTWTLRRDLSAEEVTAEAAELRRFGNLYEILPLSYWQANHGVHIPDASWQHAHRYASTALGRHHLQELVALRQRAAGIDPLDPTLADGELEVQAIGLFAGTHDLVVPRRHHIDGATLDDELCASGDQTPAEHRAMIRFTVATLSELAASYPSVRYVSVFQNWLAPAGASLEHLHKQLVAIDEHGPLMDRVITRLGEVPALFSSHVLAPAIADGLVIAGNDHAVAVAGVGHRYPTVEIYSTSSANTPWEHEPDAIDGLSDVLHAAHAATGRLIPANEEWHFRPRDTQTAMPWRVNLKWRVSTLAGFEGGTKINVNTISPFDLRQRVVASLEMLRAQKRIAALRIGDECRPRADALRYEEGAG